MIAIILLFQDPFLVISKAVESGNRIPICKTEVLQNDLNPTWKPVCLNVQQVGSKVNVFLWIIDSAIYCMNLPSSTACITPFANISYTFIVMFNVYMNNQTYTQSLRVSCCHHNPIG